MENASLPSDIWNNFTTSSSEPESSSVKAATSIRDLTARVVYCILGSVGVLDNLFVIITFALFIKITDKTMNMLIVNQSIIDLCASFFLILMAGIDVDSTGMSRDSTLDQFLCRFWITDRPVWCPLVVSTYGILLTALERYTAVIYPIWYNQNVIIKKRLVYGSIACIWIVMTAYQLVMAAVPTDIIGGRCVILGAFSSEAMEWSFGILKIMLTYLLPMALMAFCYWRIVYALRAKVGDVTSATINAAGRNATVTGLMICCGFIVCWSPNQTMQTMKTILLIAGTALVIFIFIKFVWQIGDMRGWFYHFTVMLVFANSCINPFIYAAKYREFQQGLRRLTTKLSQNSTQVVPANN